MNAIRNGVRDAVATKSINEIFSPNRRELATEMKQAIQAKAGDRIEVLDVFVRDVQAPPLVRQAIEEKLQSEQQAQRMRFVLDRERQEAERKRIEAQGIADFQNIVARGISDQLLKWKAIEVAHELSKSPNAKIIVLGDKSGLPIILSDK